MSINLRIALVIVSFALLVFIIRGIKKSRFEIADSIYWFFISALVLFTALVPGVAYIVSSLLKIESPSNFVFACGIVLLLVRTFRQEQKIASLRQKLTTLTQEEALKEVNKGN